MGRKKRMRTLADARYRRNKTGEKACGQGQIIHAKETCKPFLNSLYCNYGKAV